jgi:hypothetical protein
MSSLRNKSLTILCAAVALCLCVSEKTLSHETLTTTVLFDREIVRILNAHCVMCHSDGGPSFPLETYEQTWLAGRKVRAEVIARHMPPWAAVPGYGQFANENSLTLRETQFLVSWVEGLGPRNAGTVFTNVVDSAGKPRTAVRAQPHSNHWQLGEPNWTRQLASQTVESGSGKQIKQTVVDLGLTAERRIKALEYMPGDRRVVRAAFFSVQETGQWIGSWTPWYGYASFPDGTAVRLPAGAHIVAEIHYQSIAQPVVEKGTLGLFFADKPAATTISNVLLEAKVPNGDRFRAETRVTADTRAVALRLETAAGVKSVEVSSRRADGGTDVILFAKDIRADWPTPYILNEPVLIRRGSVLSVTAHGGPVKLTVSRY